jgi:hypothetical protein
MLSERFESTVRHFYSPWQIYLVDEANMKHSRVINVLLPLKEKEHYILEDSPYTLELSKWEELFLNLWKFRFMKNIFLEKAQVTIHGNIFVLEGKALKVYHRNCRKVGIEIYKKHSHDSWIKFLRDLCAIYFNYQNREKIALSSLVKKDIKETIDLLMLGSNKTYRKIIADVGMVVGGMYFCHIPSLERIFPEFENYLRRGSLNRLQAVSDEYNNAFPSSIKIIDQDIIDIINYAFKSRNETLLVSIIEINKEYREPSYIGNEGLWSYIRSLTSSAESWTKKLAGCMEFREALDRLTNGDFSSCCDRLQRNCNRTNLRVNSFNDLKLLLDGLSRINLTRRGRDLQWMKFIIKAYLIRNYAVHHTKLEPELFGSTFFDIYKSLLFLIFFAWKKK